MINAVVDVSNMFFRSMFIVSGYKNSYTFDSQDELDQLMRKVAMDISSIIRGLSPSRVVLAFDSRSWRKDIPIDENEGYKAQRTKSTHINWDNFYSIMDEFSLIAEQKGLIISKIKGAEADDLIALWKEKLLKGDQHVIIISGDEDVRQLVDCTESNGKKYFSAVFNPFTQGKNSSKRLFVPAGFTEWLEDSDPGDIFNRSVDIDKEDFKRITTDPKIKTELINGTQIALRKIFCGDDGDNIPAIYTWINDNQKEVRITESKFKKIVEELQIKTPKDLILKSDQIEKLLLEISNKSFTFKIKDRLDRQIKLVLLNSEIFPASITEGFNEQIEKELQKNNIASQSFNLNFLLEGTRYISSDINRYTKTSSSNESSIFKDIDKISSNKELF